MSDINELFNVLRKNSILGFLSIALDCVAVGVDAISVGMTALGGDGFAGEMLNAIGAIDSDGEMMNAVVNSSNGVITILLLCIIIFHNHSNPMP